ncbi:MAG: efflux RND transporter periplasmic adaptor subunit [Anaerolineales bacterium]|nr:efflux RND transporter periplasmic adaptor subunit [Anaerolineales bacterium]
MKTKAIVLLVVFLTGCNAFNPATPQPLPTVVLQGGSAAVQPVSPGTGGDVVASGIVVPAQVANLVFTLSGKVEAVYVAVGDSVKAGQPLVQLQGQEDLQAAVSQKQFELVQARQALDDLKTEAETARVQAMQDVIVYEKAVCDAQYALDNFTVPSNQAGLDTVEALNQMKQRLDAARLAFGPYKYRSSNDPIREDRKEDLDQAQSDYNAAVRRLQYEYDLEVAQARLSKALSDYEIFQAGPDPIKVRLAKARLSNAQTQLTAAQAALDHLALAAPFDGTAVKVNVHSGEWVVPGQAVLVLADLSRLRIETTDLSERDVPEIEIGQPVTVFIEALGQEVPGRVSDISPLADTLGGDVVYKTTIELDAIPPGLRAGMSVEVQFETDA